MLSGNFGNVNGYFPVTKIPRMQNLSVVIDEEQITLGTGPVGCSKSLSLCSYFCRNCLTLVRYGRILLK